MTPQRALVPHVPVREETASRTRPRFPLHQKIFRLSRKADYIFRRDVYRNVTCPGSPGSGKTSGPVENFQVALWNAAVIGGGDCGLILCAKPDTATKAMQIARAWDRCRSIVHIYPGSGYHFDPVSFALTNSGGRVSTDLALKRLWSMVEILHRGEVAAQGDGFFAPAGKEALNKSVRTIYLTTGKFNIEQLVQICQETGGMSLERVQADPRQFLVMRMIEHLEKHALPPYQAEVKGIRSYFMQQAALSDKTRSSIWITASTKLAPMTDRGSPIYDLFFGGETNITPKTIVEKNLLVFLDFPVSRYETEGSAIGVGFKEALQNYCINRPDDDYQRPCGIWSDEACWLTLYDLDATERGRSARLYSILAYQSDSTLVDGFGGGAVGQARATRLLASHSIRIMCAQIDAPTRESNSKVVGNTLQITENRSAGKSGKKGDADEGWSHNISYAAAWMPALPEEWFLGLETGKHGYIEAFVVIAGRKFRWNKQRWLLVRWRQNFAGFRMYETVPELSPTARPWNGHVSPLDFIYIWTEEGWKGLWYRILNFWTDGQFNPNQPGGSEYHA